MSSLDDLLNSALDELEVQEKEAPPKPTKTTTTTTTTTNTTTNTTASNIKPSFNKPIPPPMDENFGQNVNEMMDMFKKFLGDDTFKSLNEGFEKEYNSGNNNGNKEGLSGLKEEDLTEDDKKNIDEFAEKLATMFGVTADTDLNNMDEFKPFLEGLQNFDKNNNNNNNSKNTSSGVHIDNFESSISDTLKNLAENASNKSSETNGFEDIMGSLSKLMESSNFNLNGEENGQIDDLFEKSIQYMGENYPAWIERNIGNYSAEEIERFRKQSEVFTLILQKDGEDALDDSLLSRMSELGNLPDAFCDEYLSKIEGDIENDQTQQQQSQEQPKQ